MSHQWIRTVQLAMTALFGAVALFAATSSLRAEPPATRPTRVRFVPHGSDAPEKVRAGGSRCGIGNDFDKQLTYAVLVPQRRIAVDEYSQQWGVSTTESPSLFWFTNKPANLTALIMITREKEAPDSADTVFQQEIKDPLASGLQRLDLEKLGVKLQRDVLYRWSVQYISPSGERPSQKSQGLIRVLPTSDPRVTQIAASQGDKRVAACAALGVWYDLLATLSDNIDQNPADSLLRAQRAELLDTTGELRVSKWIGGP